MGNRNWPEVEMGELIESISETHHLKSHKVVLINTSDVLDGKVLNHQPVNNSNLRGQFKKSFKKHDILYSEIRPKNRRFAYVDFDPQDYVASTKLMVLRKKYPFITLEFVYHVLKSDEILDKLQIIAEARSGTFPQITFSELSRLKILLPPIPEQKAIAATLSCLDDKIELNNRINKTLEEMAQAIFKSWFVDFEPFQDGEFEDSELGPIPKGWRVGTLSDLGEVIGGSTPSKARADYYSDEGVAWITPKDLSVNKDKFISKGAVDISVLGLKNSSAKLMPKGTVLFSSRAPIGYIAIAKNEVTTNQGFKSVVPKSNIGTSYVYCFLKMNTGLIENRATGTTFKEASNAVMKQIPAIIPDDIILDQFESLCRCIFEQQSLLEEENRYLSSIRDSLLPKLMSGNIRIPM